MRLPLPSPGNQAGCPSNHFPKMANNGQGPHLLHDPVDFLAEVDELSDLVLPEEAVVVLRQLVDQLLPLLHQNVDAEQRGHLKGVDPFEGFSQTFLQSLL